MNQFQISRKFLGHRNIQMTYLGLYLLIEIGLILAGIFLPLFNNAKWVGPEEWKIVYFILVLGIVLLLIFTIKLVRRYYFFCSIGYYHFKDFNIKFEDQTISIISPNINETFQIDRVELHNHIFQSSTKNPFFGHGILVIKQADGKELAIPSIVFDSSVGAYTIRDLFKGQTNYHQYKLTWAKFKKHIANIL